MRQNEYLWSKGLNGLENIMGKGENAGHQHFVLLFPQCFQKPSFLGHTKKTLVEG